MNIRLGCALCLLFATIALCDVYNVQFNNNGGHSSCSDNHKKLGHQENGGKCGYGGHDGHDGHKGDDDDSEMEEYIVAISAEDEELDIDEPHLVGFHYDMFSAAAKAGKCEITLVHDLQHRCVAKSAPRSELPYAPGRSLQYQNYDGCAGIRLVEGLDMIGYTSSQYAQSGAGYAIKTGDVINEASKIGFIAEDELEAVVSQEIPYYNSNNRVEYTEYETAAEELKNDKVDAIFVSEDAYELLKEQAGKMELTLAAFTPVKLPGFGLFADKRSSGLIECFNDGLKKLHDNGEFDKICLKYKEFITCEYDEDGKPADPK